MFLRVDPDKEKQISAAREWALNLIDANAGGVKFSQEARAQLLKKRLEWDYVGSTYYSEPFVEVPRRPPSEPPR